MRVRLRGKEEAATWRSSGSRKRDVPGSEDKRLTNRSRVASLFTLGAARHVADAPGGEKRFQAAKASAQRRRRGAETSKLETAAFVSRIAGEAERQASQSEFWRSSTEMSR